MTRAVRSWMDEVVDQQIDGVDRIAPEAGDIAQRSALPELPFLADDAAQAPQLMRHALVAYDHFVERVGHAAGNAIPFRRQPDCGVSSLERVQRSQDDGQFVRGTFDRSITCMAISGG